MTAVRYHVGRFPRQPFRTLPNALRPAASRNCLASQREKCGLSLIRYTQSRLSLTFAEK